MNILHFNASIINTNEENEVLTLGFSEDDSFEKYVLIQHQRFPLTLEEKVNGWTTYYVSISPLNEGGYNLISSVKCTETNMLISLNEKGKKILLLESISINYNKKDFQKIVKPSIIEIFADTNLLAINN